MAIFSSGMAKIPSLAALLGAERVALRPSDAEARGIDAVIGWGEKPSSRAAKAYAQRHGLPYLRAEDGFLRSVGLGVAGDPPLSIVLDDLGIYYDARTESRLERILAQEDLSGLLERARTAIDRIRTAGLSKYNDAPPGPVDLGPPGERRVLVVDQTFGDLSIGCGLADASSFDAMLKAALDENPDATIVVKTHPDVLAGKKRGYLGSVAGDRIRLLARACPPSALLPLVDRVYAVTSQLGFEALLWGKPVTCFGAPWYAGWGATDDRVAVPRRGRPRTIEELFAAGYLLYPRYLDPDTARAGTLEPVIEHLALQREAFDKNQGTLYCFGFRFWKRAYMRAYLRSPGNRIVFAASPAALDDAAADARVVVWGQREPAHLREVAARRRIPMWRVEDGFLRSVGLGSDLAMPASLVVDRAGIYYDPTQPSDLEDILEHADFSEAELARARALRRLVIERGISKYNVGQERRLSPPPGRRVVLVPGQVEDDASIRLGCPGVHTNLGLLEAARAACPDAWIVWKPHPDVLSGNRKGAVDAARAHALCDHVEEEASLAACLAVADEVHTLSSLVGFEALLRELRVVVHGLPFYAGWGLTEDRAPIARRTRRRTLDELVAAALLRYPRYIDRRTGRFTTPEATIAALVAERDANAAARVLHVSWARRQLRKVVHAYRGLVHAP